MSGAGYADTAGHELILEHVEPTYSSHINAQRPDPNSLTPTDTGSIGDRTFDDGYNNISPPTTTPGPGEGLTWFWGYNNNAQYDATSHQLTMNRQATYTESGSFQIIVYHENTRQRLNLPKQWTRTIQLMEQRLGYKFQPITPFGNTSIST